MEKITAEGQVYRLGCHMAALGMKRADLARLAGVHRNTVANWMNGKKAHPPLVRAYFDLLMRVREIEEAARLARGA